MFGVTVQFTIDPTKLADFMPLMTENARLSLAREAGCHRFDVCQNPDEVTSIFLYEVYSDRAAFDAHLASEHFQAFNASVAGMVAEKSVKTFELLV